MEVCVDQIHVQIPADVGFRRRVGVNTMIHIRLERVGPVPGPPIPRKIPHASVFVVDHHGDRLADLGHAGGERDRSRLLQVLDLNRDGDRIVDRVRCRSRGVLAVAHVDRQRVGRLALEVGAAAGCDGDPAADRFVHEVLLECGRVGSAVGVNPRVAVCVSCPNCADLKPIVDVLVNGQPPRCRVAEEWRQIGQVVDQAAIQLKAERRIVMTVGPASHVVSGLYLPIGVRPTRRQAVRIARPAGPVVDNPRVRRLVRGANEHDCVGSICRQRQFTIYQEVVHAPHDRVWRKERRTVVAQYMIGVNEDPLIIFGLCTPLPGQWIDRFVVDGRTNVGVHAIQSQEIDINAVENVTTRVTAGREVDTVFRSRGRQVILHDRGRLIGPVGKTKVAEQDVLLLLTVDRRRVRERDHGQQQCRQRDYGEAFQPTSDSDV